MTPVKTLSDGLGTRTGKMVYSHIFLCPGNILIDQKDLSEQNKTAFYVGHVKCLILLIIVFLITVIRVRKPLSYCN